MPSLHLLLAFAATTAIFAVIPGPAMLYAAARTLAGGRRAGLMASLGIYLGGYGHVIAAASGLSILFQAVPLLYATVKIAGALYLVCLGIELFRAGPPDRQELATAAMRSGRRAFLESVSVELLNPKTALFFLAFLPQFIDPTADAAVWVQLVVLGTIVNLMFSSTDIVCVLFAAAVMARMRRSSRAQRALRRAGGTVLVGLGAHLALQQR